MEDLVPYPGMPGLRLLPRSTGTGGDGGQRADPELVALVLEEDAAGRSLQEIAELSDRSHITVRCSLQRRGLLRRGRGAPSATSSSSERLRGAEPR